MVPDYYYKIACALDSDNDYPTIGFYGLNSKSTSSEHSSREKIIQTKRSVSDMLSEIDESFDAVNEFLNKNGFPEVSASCGQKKDLNSHYWSSLSP